MFAERRRSAPPERRPPARRAAVGMIPIALDARRERIVAGSRLVGEGAGDGVGRRRDPGVELNALRREFGSPRHPARPRQRQARQGAEAQGRRQRRVERRRTARRRARCAVGHAPLPHLRTRPRTTPPSRRRTPSRRAVPTGRARPGQAPRAPRHRISRPWQTLYAAAAVRATRTRAAAPGPAPGETGNSGDRAMFSRRSKSSIVALATLEGTGTTRG